MKYGVIMFPTDYSIDPVSLAREVEARGFESSASSRGWRVLDAVERQRGYSAPPGVGLASSRCRSLSQDWIASGISCFSDSAPAIAARMSIATP